MADVVVRVRGTVEPFTAVVGPRRVRFWIHTGPRGGGEGAVRTRWSFGQEGGPMWTRGSMCDSGTGFGDSTGGVVVKARTDGRQVRERGRRSQNKDCLRQV